MYPCEDSNKFQEWVYLGLFFFQAMFKAFYIQSYTNDKRVDGQVSGSLPSGHRPNVSHFPLVQYEQHLRNATKMWAAHPTPSLLCSDELISIIMDFGEQ